MRAIPGERICLWLPLPPRQLSSNGSYGSHWSHSSAVRDYRHECAVVALCHAAATPANWPTPNRVRVSLLFGTQRQPHDGRYRPRDPTNAVSAAKALIDGLRDAGVIREDSAKHFELGSVTIDSKVEPGVYVTVEVIE